MMNKRDKTRLFKIMAETGVNRTLEKELTNQLMLLATDLKFNNTKNTLVLAEKFAHLEILLERYKQTLSCIKFSNRVCNMKEAEYLELKKLNTGY